MRTISFREVIPPKDGATHSGLVKLHTFMDKIAMILGVFSSSMLLAVGSTEKLLLKFLALDGGQFLGQGMQSRCDDAI